MSLISRIAIYREHSTSGSISTYAWEDFEKWEGAASFKEERRSSPQSLPVILSLLPPSLPSFLFLLFAMLEVEPMASAHKLSRLPFAIFLLVIDTVNKGPDPPIQGSSSHLLD